ncbi:MAG: protoporphyrinogen oxidase [Chthoniobacterales bacterium]|nr:protoporphyrinogen oxidase [Chthoniobacterales bacterium]
MENGQRHVLVIGAGLTGLTVAAGLKKRGASVILLESNSRAGGAVESGRENGFLVEHGPNSMMVNDPEVHKFLRDSGLEKEIIRPLAKKRFIVRRGIPVALPSGPLGAVTTPLFGLAGKFRVVAEPFVRRGLTDDESLADLVRRRLGPEMLRYAIEPFVAGIFAGDPERLSSRYAFPKLWNLEKTHGSFIRGALRLRRSGPPQEMISFRKGMGALPAQLAEFLGDDIRFGAQVENVRRQTDGAWSVVWNDGGATREIRCGELVCTVPAFAVPPLPWPEELRAQLEFLQDIEYPPVTVVALGFRRKDVGHALDGFGMLVPSAEKRGILGTIFSSSLFPERAPEDCVLLTTFVGGARQPRIAATGDDALVCDICSDLRDLLRLSGDPVFQKIIRWPRAIPQYNLGYGRYIAEMEKLETTLPGLHLAGNYRGGIAAGQCIRNGLHLAETLAAKTNTQTP